MPRLADVLRRVVQTALPWYHGDEVEARHAESRRAVREARRVLAMRADYRAADRRIGRMSGR